MQVFYLGGDPRKCCEGVGKRDRGREERIKSVQMSGEWMPPRASGGTIHLDIPAPRLTGTMPLNSLSEA